MTPPRLPLELLLMIAHHITDDQGERGFADFNAFLQVNRALYSCLNPILWRSATEHSAITTQVLTHLICGNHLPRLQYFLELGADVETVLPDFNTPDRELLDPSPLVVAAYHLDSVPLARLLLENGAKVQYDEPRYSALHAARSAEMVQLLMAHQADPEQKDCDHHRPLHWYAKRDDIAAMQAVLRCGVNVDPLDTEYRIPLHEARSAEAVTLLLEFGADVKMQDCLGDTPLHCMTKDGSTEAVRLLVEYWPDGVMVTDNLFGATPLHVAQETGNMDAARVMAKHCPAARWAKNMVGETPTESGIRRRSAHMIDLIVSLMEDGDGEVFGDC
jgi:hypothetical protein